MVISPHCSPYKVTVISYQFTDRDSSPPLKCTSKKDLLLTSFSLLIFSSTYFKPTLISWIKRDQHDVTCFIISLFDAQHVSDVNTSILRSLRLISWVISWVVLLWFDVCWCYVVVWLGWCGVVSVCRLKRCFNKKKPTWCHLLYYFII